MALAENTTTLPAPSRRKAPTAPKASLNLSYRSPEDYPDLYAVRVNGDCMAPVYPHGSIIVVDKTLPCRRGDDVIIYLGRDGEPPYEGVVKRLVLALPRGTKLPYVHDPRSTVAPLILVAMLNPEVQIQYKPENVVAIHRVVRLARTGECQG